MSVWPVDNQPRMGLFELYLIEFLFFFFLYFKVITRLAGMEEVPINVDFYNNDYFHFNRTFILQSWSR